MTDGQSEKLRVNDGQIVKVRSREEFLNFFK